ncbi:NUCLEAR FACTOR Y, SUBUNIT B9, LEAFY COTYLEDON 1, EMBRYO DEFECTIVE 212 [Hibiscus trionum]|uniref:NUCLEAR FACTOR Y, SUBUNIT B9, LEAFY COTYLEDON 1, EMBRYO DEFECTIVE 212 n=1 Tax=Hibiscus trionum TaxID=183268 RepID=A0A9W7HAW3_HIBTR|nr:NUCLEAR FACTOR Y, SUBUNIT B9, LEAFY COTYLEDON 1, EMBRYO DEFECTIVE 212 [Hibiscus trionum]
MERGDRFIHFHKLAKSTSGSSIIRHGNSSNSTNNGGNTNSNSSPPLVREQDRFMPIANVIRIMRRMLPPHAKISDESKETIQECVSEFISFITGEANERCQQEQRKTITAEDVLWAMGKLGFDDYVEPLTVFLNRYREAENDRTSLHGEPILKRGVDHGPAMTPHFNSSTFQVGFGRRFFDAAATTNAITGGYNRDASGAATAAGSSSQASTINFDPFGQFK